MTTDVTTQPTVAEVNSSPVRLNPLDILGLGLLGVRTRPLRAALSALGISIGVATMIVVTGIPASSQQALMNQFATLGTNLLRAEATPDTATGKAASLPEQSTVMAKRIGSVEQVSAIANPHATVRRSDQISAQETSGLAVLACQLNLLDTLNGTVLSGAFLTP